MRHVLGGSALTLLRLRARVQDFITAEQLAQVLGDEAEYLKSSMPEVEGGYDYKAWAADVFSR